MLIRVCENVPDLAGGLCFFKKFDITSSRNDSGTIRLVKPLVNVGGTTVGGLFGMLTVPDRAARSLFRSLGLSKRLAPNQ